MSIQQLQTLLAAAAEAGGAPNFGDPPAKARADFAAFLTSLPTPDGVTVTDHDVAGVPGLLVIPDGGSARIGTLYLHGGAYIAGDARGYIGIIANLAKESGRAVYALDYRLAPEARFPGAVVDALAVYRELVDQVGAQNLAVAGDSAGGGLATALLIAAREAGVPQPAAAVLFSPWGDLTCAGASITDRAERDPLLTREGLLAAAEVYLDGADALDALASPALANLSGLAPITVHVGSEEILHDDAVRIAEASGGVLKVWDGMVHVWGLFWFAVDESREVLESAGETIRTSIASAFSADADTPSHSEHDVVIIGAGVAGLYMLHTARALGLNAVVVERGDGVGGTWYWNRYPGARCDVESLDYSYSWDEDLQREWRWAEKYSTQPDILAYLEHVADRFDLERDIQLGVSVDGAEFDEEAGTWTVRAEDGSTFTAPYVVAATGVLSAPKRSTFPGQDDFTGPVLVSNQWPEEGYDFTGKRVAVIGVGSTGIQITPVIAEAAERVFVLQRTPSYSIPAYNRFLTDEEFDEAVAGYPERRRKARQTLLGVDTRHPDRATFDVTEEERVEAYRKSFDYGGPMVLMTTFNDAVVDRKANDVAVTFLSERILERVGGNAELAARVTPTYAAGSRRLCVDTDYYETLTKDHVELVDLRQTPIETFTPTGIRTSGGDIDVDVIVLATGFDAITGPLSAIDPRGEGGVSLRKKWAESPASYLGVMVAGFPNLFTVTGPQSPSVNSNMFVAIEQHIEFITKLLARATGDGRAVVRATAEAEQAWGEHNAEVAAMTVFPQTDSWYTGANIAGKAAVFMPYLGGINGYQAQLDDIVANDMRGFTFAYAPTLVSTSTGKDQS